MQVSMPTSAPQGVLQILVSEARHLMKKDHSLAGGKSDPYITISIGEKKISFVDRVGSHQSKELTRGPSELVQHFLLQGEFTSA